VQVEINTKTFMPVVGQSLFECADQVGVVVPTSCRKNGKCRECLVEVISGSQLLSPPSPEEEHLREGFRLSCRAQVVGTSGIIKCHTLRRGKLRIEDNCFALHDTPGPKGIDPAVTRNGSWVLLDGEKLVEASGPLHGLAVDVGTTTVVVRLVDLENGDILEVESFENPQRFAGTDIMARILYDTEQDGHLLQRTLLAYLGHAIEAFSCDRQTIYEIVVAANTTMRDLLFGLDVYSVGQRPYRSLTEVEMAEGIRDSTSLSTTAKKLRLPVFPAARVYSLPLIGGHVGADAAACLLAVELAHEDRTIALMDIGTNTELIVGNRHKILAASCPAGPAFEGGAITCGMPGLDGAIETITLSDENSDKNGIALGIIGGGVPLGICGSGLIDGLSELLRTKRINQLGRFVDESERFNLTLDEQVFIHEQDISELAQAKGAHVAGLRIVLRNYGIDIDDLDRFYLAGGFAKHLSLVAARRIGLIPDLPDEKLIQVGNASIEGATRALCSISIRNELESVVQNIGHVELETDEQFFNYFVEGCQFVPMKNLTCQA
jgi:uncharacterized 2Fe-2S/4Fe-4S cluster protein (DUF4445 family)